MLHIHSEKKLLDSGVINNIGNWFFKIAVTLIPLLAYLAEIVHLHESIEVNVVKGPERAFYGATEFSIQDVNGYILTFAEEE